MVRLSVDPSSGLEGKKERERERFCDDILYFTAAGVLAPKLLYY